MVPRSGRTLQLSSKKQPLGLHLRWRSTTGALHTPEGQLADAPSRTLWRQPRPWTSWRTTLPLSSLQLPLDDCSSAAADAVEASANRTHPQHFDLVVSSGGLAAFYGGAVSSVLATLQQRGLLQVGSLHGVSSGALVCATFLGCEAGFTKLSDMYRCHEIFVQARPWLSYGMREFLDECLPPDIHERASGRMHVTVSEVLAPKEPGGLVNRNLWPRKRVISEFRTRVEFLDTVMASTIIPGITAPHPHATSGGGFQLDGVKVLAPPPSAARPQLRIEQMGAARRLRYPKRWLLRTSDADVDVTLALPALKDTVRLLGEGVPLPHQAMSFQDGTAPPRRGVRGAAARGINRMRCMIDARRGEERKAEGAAAPARAAGTGDATAQLGQRDDA